MLLFWTAAAAGWGGRILIAADAPPLASPERQLEEALLDYFLASTGDSEIRERAFALATQLAGRESGARYVQIAADQGQDLKYRRDAVDVLRSLKYRQGCEALSGIARRPDADPVLREKVVAMFAAIADDRLVPFFTKALNDPRPPERRFAAFSLAELGGDPRPVLPVLLAELRSPDVRLRLKAMAALGALRVTEAIEPLLSMLESRSRAAAMDALETVTLVRLRSPSAWQAWWEKTKTGFEVLKAEPRSVADLTRVVCQSGSPPSKRVAQRLLVRVGPQGVPQVLKSIDQAVRREAAAALADTIAEMGEAVIPDVVAALSSERRVEAYTARLTLIRLGQSAAPYLARAAGDSALAVETRTAAILILGSIGGKVTLEPLSRSARSEEPEIKRAALRALAETRDAAALPLLLDLLVEDDPSVRTRVTRAITRLGPPVVPALCAKLEEAIPEPVRVGIVEALGILRDGRALPALTLAAEEGPVPLKTAALTSLGLLGKPEAVALLVKHLGSDEPSVQSAAQQALILIAPNALSAVVEVLQEAGGDERYRVTMVKCVTHSRAPAAAATIVELLGDPNEDVRRECATGLGVIGGEAARDALMLTALRDEAASVRAAAARGLRTMRDPAALGSLVAALEDDDEAVLQEVIPALGVIRRQEAADALVAKLEVVPAELRPAIVRALIGTGLESAGPVLLSVAGNPQDPARAIAVRGLGALRVQEAVGLLTGLIDSRSAPLVEGSIISLGQIGDPRGVQALTKALRTGPPQYRALAAGSLGFLGDRTAIKPLIEAFKTGATPVRIDAANALVRLAEPEALVPVFIAALGIEETDHSFRRLMAAYLGRLLGKHSRSTNQDVWQKMWEEYQKARQTDKK